MTGTTSAPVSPLRLVREARDYLLAAARTQSFLKRSELVIRAEQRLQAAEGALKRLST